jgi:parallel beta-helix repeat protein
MKKLLLGLVLAIACLSMSSIGFAACVVPTDGMTITQFNVNEQPNKVKICNILYGLNNGIYIGSDNLVIDCDHGGLTGIGNAVGIDINSHSGITIQNCEILNYLTGIALLYSNHDNIVNNSIGSNKVAIGLFNSNNNVIEENQMLAPYTDSTGVVIENSNNNIIANNNIFTTRTIQFVCGVMTGYQSNNPYNNIIFGNAFTEGFVNGCSYQEYDSSIDNIFCYKDIGNTYMYGATGPSCPTTTNLEPRVSALESWKTTIDLWKSSIDSWKSSIESWKITIDSWKTTIDSAITNILSQLSVIGVKYAMITINSPMNQTYSTSSVRVDLKLIEKVNTLKMSMNGGSYTTLCSNCNYYNATKYFSTKMTYNVTFKAFDSAGNVLDSNSVIFTRGSGAYIKVDRVTDSNIIYSNPNTETITGITIVASDGTIITPTTTTLTPGQVASQTITRDAETSFMVKGYY